MSPLLEANTLRLQTDVCARAELVLTRALEINNGAPFFGTLWSAAKELAESGTIPEDDWEAVEYAYIAHCRKEGVPLPEDRRTRA